MKITEQMSLLEKLNILSDAAKYDVACTSSGVDRQNAGNGIGNCAKAGICHSFSADGRCISLLKILFTNECIHLPALSYLLSCSHKNLRVHSQNSSQKSMLRYFPVLPS